MKSFVNKLYGSGSEEKYQSFGAKKVISLVVVGETGAGKSTLLKALRDYVSGVSFRHITPTEKSEKQGESQTQYSTQHKFVNEERNLLVKILDTPGLADTCGLEKDNRHLDNIIDTLSNYGEFHAIVVVLKSGTNRAGPSIRYVIGKIRENLPKDVANNFMVVVTRTDDVSDDTLAVIRTLGLPTEYDRVLAVDNSAYCEYPPANDPRKERKRKQKQRRTFEETQETLEELLERVGNERLYRPYRGDKIRELKNRRNDLQALLQQMVVNITNSVNYEQRLIDKEKERQMAVSDRRLYANFTSDIVIDKLVKIDTPGQKNTQCGVCQNTCHANCQLSKWSVDMEGCACAGSNGYCNTCKHSMSNHLHKPWRYEKRKETKQQVNYSKKTNFDDAKKRESDAESAKSNFRRLQRECEQERADAIRTIQACYRELEQMAIIGYNESYETYIQTQIKAVESSTHLSKGDRDKTIGVYQKALKTFKVFKAAVTGGDVVQVFKTK